MLSLARSTLGVQAGRVDFHEGYVDTAPAGPYDAATCLLTLHFVEPGERLATLGQIRRRLWPGAPLVVAHHSFPQSGPDKARWLERYAAFAIGSGVPAANARKAIEAIARQLPVLPPDKDEALLRRAGFERVEQFYAGFTFRGWVGLNAGP